MIDPTSAKSIAHDMAVAARSDRRMREKLGSMTYVETQVALWLLAALYKEAPWQKL